MELIVVSLEKKRPQPPWVSSALAAQWPNGPLWPPRLGGRPRGRRSTQAAVGIRQSEAKVMTSWIAIYHLWTMVHNLVDNGIPHGLLNGS
jgi:hypothetical protein